ncbi:hypothetical protein FUAX_09690 [Fulvitalea axinellae]|uniref:Uncharacterized protein n=1 Tax=Fulvitalea axinellae TaxID=1182444 RepID=A0AAU9CNL8_9BACT|nr:hypothetical protein FUAX_09690 [Fulvitalea axinellae]
MHIRHCRGIKILYNRSSCLFICPLKRYKAGVYDQGRNIKIFSLKVGNIEGLFTIPIVFIFIEQGEYNEQHQKLRESIRRIREPYVQWCERRTEGLWLMAVYSVSCYLLSIFFLYSRNIITNFNFFSYVF